VNSLFILWFKPTLAEKSCLAASIVIGLAIEVASCNYAGIVSFQTFVRYKRRLSKAVFTKPRRTSAFALINSDYNVLSSTVIALKPFIHQYSHCQIVQVFRLKHLNKSLQHNRS